MHLPGLPNTEGAHPRGCEKSLILQAAGVTVTVELGSTVERRGNCCDVPGDRASGCSL